MTVVQDIFAANQQTAYKEPTLQGVQRGNKGAIIETSLQVEGMLQAYLDGKDAQIDARLKEDWLPFLATADTSKVSNKAKKLLGEYFLKLANDGSAESKSKLAAIANSALIKKLVDSSPNLKEPAKALLEYLTLVGDNDEAARKQYFAKTLSKFYTQEGVGVTTYGPEISKLKASRDPLLSVLSATAFKWVSPDAQAFKDEFHSATIERKSTAQMPTSVGLVQAELIMDKMRDTFTRDGGLLYGDVKVEPITVSKEDLDKVPADSPLKRTLNVGDVFKFDDWVKGILTHEGNAESLAERVGKFVGYYSILLNRFNKLIETKTAAISSGNLATAEAAKKEIASLAKQMKAVKKVFSDGFGINEQVGKLISSGLQNLGDLKIFFAAGANKEEELQLVNEALNDITKFANTNVGGDKFIKGSKIAITYFDKDGNVTSTVPSTGTATVTVKGLKKQDENGNKASGEESLEHALDLLRTNLETTTTNIYNHAVEELTGNPAQDAQKLTDYKDDLAKFSEQSAASKYKDLFKDSANLAKLFGKTGISVKDNTTLKGLINATLSSDVIGGSGLDGVNERIKEITDLGSKSNTEQKDLLQILKSIKSIATNPTKSLDEDSIVKLQVAIVAANAFGSYDDTDNKAIITTAKAFLSNPKPDADDLAEVVKKLDASKFAKDSLQQVKEGTEEYLNKLVPQNIEQDVVTESLKRDGIMKIFTSTDPDYKAASKAMADVLKADSAHLKDINDVNDILHLARPDSAGPLARILLTKEENGDDINYKLRYQAILEIARKAAKGKDPAQQKNIYRLVARELLSLDPTKITDINSAGERLQTLAKTIGTENMSGKEYSTQFIGFTKVSDQIKTLAQANVAIGFDLQEKSAVQFADFFGRLNYKGESTSVKDGCKELSDRISQVMEKANGGNMTYTSAVAELQEGLTNPFAKSILEQQLGGTNQFDENKRGRIKGNMLMTILQKIHVFASIAASVLGISSKDSSTTANYHGVLTEDKKELQKTA